MSTALETTEQPRAVSHARTTKRLLAGTLAAWAVVVIGYVIVNETHLSATSAVGHGAILWQTGRIISVVGFIAALVISIVTSVVAVRYARLHDSLRGTAFLTAAAVTLLWFSILVRVAMFADTLLAQYGIYAHGADSPLAHAAAGIAFFAFLGTGALAIITSLLALHIGRRTEAAVAAHAAGATRPA